MPKGTHLDVLKKVFYFLLPAILTIILVLSIITVVRARALEVGSPPAVSVQEETKTEGTVAMPAEKMNREESQEGVQKEMPGTDQSGTQEKAEPDADKKLLSNPFWVW